jgi:release factor glutamine methyltransferase
VNQKKWMIKDLLEVTADYLDTKGIDNPRLSAEILLAHQLRTSRIRLYLDFDQPIGDRDITQYRSMVKRLLHGEPVQYITGVQEFWSLEFRVNPQVLIPRPETEILVEQVLSVLRKEEKAGSTDCHILDLGTGSGAIAVSLAKELKGPIVWATDISGGAMKTAEENSQRHGVAHQIRFMEGDLFAPLTDRGIPFDIIVSNPPYIPSEDFDSLPIRIRNYEPRLALEGGEKGLFIIERIIREAPLYLKPGGRLFMEMDPGQISKALDRIKKTRQYGETEIIKDYAHKERVITAKKIEY